MNQAKPKCVICDREIHVSQGYGMVNDPAGGQVMFHWSCGNEQDARKAVGFNAIKDGLLDIQRKANEFAHAEIDDSLTTDGLQHRVKSICVLIERLAMNVGNLMGTMK